MIVAGIGCKRGTPAEAIIAAVQAALAENGLRLDDVGILATAQSKAAEPGINGAARQLNLPLVPLAGEALEACADQALTRSERVLALMHLPCLAETAALAAAGAGARLLAPRYVLGTATCALALCIERGSP